jgi:hypothetical protein
MTLVDLGVLGGCDARTQGASIAVAIGATEDAAAPAQPVQATQTSFWLEPYGTLFA